MADAEQGVPDQWSDTVFMIDDHRISLCADTDVRALAAEIMKAVLAGGAFVHLSATRGRSFDVLVTKRSRIMLWHRDLAVMTAEPDAPWQTGVDLEY